MEKVILIEGKPHFYKIDNNKLFINLLPEINKLAIAPSAKISLKNLADEFVEGRADQQGRAFFDVTKIPAKLSEKMENLSDFIEVIIEDANVPGLHSKRQQTKMLAMEAENVAKEAAENAAKVAAMEAALQVATQKLDAIAAANEAAEKEAAEKLIATEAAELVQLRLDKIEMEQKIENLTKVQNYVPNVILKASKNSTLTVAATIVFGIVCAMLFFEATTTMFANFPKPLLVLFGAVYGTLPLIFSARNATLTVSGKKIKGTTVLAVMDTVFMAYHLWPDYLYPVATIAILCMALFVLKSLGDLNSQTVAEMEEYGY